MRGHDDQAAHLFSYVSPEQRVPADHPLRAIRQMTDRVLATLSPKFTRMYSTIGRPSIAPEKLLRTLLLQAQSRRPRHSGPTPPPPSPQRRPPAAASHFRFESASAEISAAQGPVTTADRPYD